MEVFVKKQLSKYSPDSLTIPNTHTKGSSAFTIQDNLDSSMKFEHLVLSYDGMVKPAGTSPGFHTDIDFTGSVEGRLKIIDAGEGRNGGFSRFTWEEGSVSKGSIKMISTVEGGGSIPFDIAVNDMYGPQTVVDYKYQSKSLLIAGTVDGANAWNYGYNRV